MTTYAPPTDPGTGMTAADLAQASGLRPDLVVRFIPIATTTPAGPLYNRHHVALARAVKQLTNAGASQSAVDAVVRDLRDRPHIDIAWSTTKAADSPRRFWTIVSAAVATALVTGGVIGGVITGTESRSDSKATVNAAPVTVTKKAPPAQITPTIPTIPDPVCPEWAPLLDAYNAREAPWTKTDPQIPASQWSEQQRDLTIAVISIMREEANDMRRLSAQAQDPYLAGLMRGQATYEDAYATKLHNYVPADHKYWDAVIAFSGTVKAVCSAAR
jgi:hypothetical protein